MNDAHETSEMPCSALPAFVAAAGEPCSGSASPSPSPSPATAPLVAAPEAALLVPSAPVDAQALPAAEPSLAPAAGSTEASVAACAVAPREGAGVGAPASPLTEATAHDLEAALAERTDARQRVSKGQSAERGDELIARKLVLRRDRWDALLRLTDALQAQRGIVATPAEVAAIVLDAGLNVILEESAQASVAAAAASAKAPVRTRSRRKSPPASASLASQPETERSAAAVAPGEPAAPRGRAARVKGARGRRAKLELKVLSSKSPKRRDARGLRSRAARAAPTSPASAPRARSFTGAELSQVRGLVKGLESQRSVQRTLALWIGSSAHNGVPVPIEDLRALCRELSVYDTANFAQNMKKDSAYFTEIRDRTSGERLGYALTALGSRAAADLAMAPSRRS